MLIVKPTDPSKILPSNVTVHERYFGRCGRRIDRQVDPSAGEEWETKLHASGDGVPSRTLASQNIRGNVSCLPAVRLGCAHADLPEAVECAIPPNGTAHDVIVYADGHDRHAPVDNRRRALSTDLYGNPSAKILHIPAAKDDPSEILNGASITRIAFKVQNAQGRQCGFMHTPLVQGASPSLGWTDFPGRAGRRKIRAAHVDETIADRLDMKRASLKLVDRAVVQQQCPFVVIDRIRALWWKETTGVQL